jgi:hypothetical protein
MSVSTGCISPRSRTGGSGFSSASTGSITEPGTGHAVAQRLALRRCLLISEPTDLAGVTAYGGIASASSAVLGSKGLCSSSSFDLLIVSPEYLPRRHKGTHVFSLLVEFIVLQISSYLTKPVGYSQSIKPSKLAEDMRLVIFLVYFIDSCHFLHAFRLEMGGSIPLSVMWSFGLDSRLR